MLNQIADADGFPVEVSILFREEFSVFPTYIVKSTPTIV